MDNKYKSIIYYSVILLTIVVGTFGIYRLILKPDLPFQYARSDPGLYCENKYATIDSGSILVKTAGQEVHTEFELEFIVDSKQIAQNIVIETEHNGEQSETTVILVPYYSNLSFIIVSVIIGIAFLICALFVISKRPDDASARMLFWILLMFALATVTSPGKFSPGFDIASITVRIAHTAGYILGISTFLHFSMIFPGRHSYAKNLMRVFYTVFVLLILVISYVSIEAMRNLDPGLLKIYELMWTLTQAILACSIAWGLTNFILNKRRLHNKSDSSKINWILWGITVGVFPYVILFIIPTVTGLPLPLPEGFSLLFLIFIPFSFAIAVIKYHIFDIEVVINRSIVYAVLTAFVIGLYFSIIALVSAVFQNFFLSTSSLTYLITVFAIAFLFNPIRTKIQHYVDVTLYREKYNFEKSIKAFTERIGKNSTLASVGKTVIEEIKALIPVDRIALILLDRSGERTRILAEKDFENLTENIGALRVKQLGSDFVLPFALEDKIQQSLKVDTSLTSVLKRWDINLVIPLRLEPKTPIGAIVLGNKLSGLKYSVKDFELLNVLSSDTAIALNRLQLQEELLLKEIEKQKLEELNNLKSFFVSSVSHDLKTPLTSIRMFAEMLRTRQTVSLRKKNEYLSIIEGESDRLGQLIDNVLRYSRIESNVLQYNFERYCLNELAEEVIELMKYQFKINKFVVKTIFRKGKFPIFIDKSAFQSILINLLSNSIKYSHKIREITLTTGKDGKYAFIKVRDRGIGIPEGDICKIFEPFYRSDNQGLSKMNGTGLGLAIVKHTMDDHKGKIEVSSKMGKGSCFKLYFPLIDKETNLKNI